MSTRGTSSSSSSSGIGFTGALTLLFVALKLLDVIDWPWIWVLSPLWIAVLVFLLVLAAVLGWEIHKGRF